MRGTRLLRLLWLPATLVLYGLLALSTLVGQRGLLHLWELRQEQCALEADVITLLRENEDLRDHITRLQTDHEFLETVAREELNFVRKGQTLHLYPIRAHTHHTYL